MIIKSYIAEQNPQALNDHNFIIFYGENDGIKDFFKTELKKINNGAEIINLFQEEIIKNNNLLFDNIQNSSLFNSKKIFLIHEATDKIYDDVIKCIEKNKDNNKIYIFSNLLDKKSKLRNFFEKDKKVGVIACYEDNERTLFNFVNNKLKGFTGTTPDIINLIIKNSNNNRSIIISELLKIKQFFENKKINKLELEQLLNIKSDKDFSKIRDACLIGDKQNVNKLISELEFLPEDIFYYINLMNIRLSKLLEIIVINNTLNNHSEAIDSAKPKVFWKDKPIYLQQLKKWNQKNIQNILNKMNEIETLMKTNSQIRNDVLIKNLLLLICKKASSIT